MTCPECNHVKNCTARQQCRLTFRPLIKTAPAAHAVGDVNPWHPMTDQTDRKTIGKLLEELGECTSAAARCDIQGIDEAHPETGKVNREWLEDEIADVLAGFALTRERFGLNISEERIERKIAALRAWHAMA